MCCVVCRSWCSSPFFFFSYLHNTQWAPCSGFVSWSASPMIKSIYIKNIVFFFVMHVYEMMEWKELIGLVISNFEITIWSFLHRAERWDIPFSYQRCHCSHFNLINGYLLMLSLSILMHWYRKGSDLSLKIADSNPFLPLDVFIQYTVYVSCKTRGNLNITQTVIVQYVMPFEIRLLKSLINIICKIILG